MKDATCISRARAKGLSKFLLMVIAAILAILAWLAVMFWGLLSTGNLVYAWLFGVALVFAVAIYCGVSTLLEKRARYGEKAQEKEVITKNA